MKHESEIPRDTHNQKRALEIIAAMDRYVRANKPIPGEWVDELRDMYEAV